MKTAAVCVEIFLDGPAVRGTPASAFIRRSPHGTLVQFSSPSLYVCSV